jgi:REP element-mobilizing transposase RayT
MKKTIAQQLNIKDFPFVINDKQGNIIYFESSTGHWAKYERDKQWNEIYYEDSFGEIRDNRVKEMTKEEAEKQFKIKIVLENAKYIYQNF